MYRDDIPLDGNYFDSIEYWTTSGGAPGTSTRSTLADNGIWASTTSWAPNDDPNLDLDLDDHMFNESMTADVGDTFDSAPLQVPPQKKKHVNKPKSEASVRFLKSLKFY